MTAAAVRTRSSSSPTGATRSSSARTATAYWRRRRPGESRDRRRLLPGSIGRVLRRPSRPRGSLPANEANSGSQRTSRRSRPRPGEARGFLGSDDLLHRRTSWRPRGARGVPGCDHHQSGCRSSTTRDAARRADLTGSRRLRPLARARSSSAARTSPTSLLRGNWLYWPSLVFRAGGVKRPCVPRGPADHPRPRPRPRPDRGRRAAGAWTRSSPSPTGATPRAPPPPSAHGATASSVTVVSSPKPLPGWRSAVAAGRASRPAPLDLAAARPVTGCRGAAGRILRPAQGDRPARLHALSHLAARGARSRWSGQRGAGRAGQLPSRGLAGRAQMAGCPRRRRITTRTAYRASCTSGGQWWLPGPSNASPASSTHVAPELGDVGTQVDVRQQPRHGGHHHAHADVRTCRRPSRRRPWPPSAGPGGAAGWCTGPATRGRRAPPCRLDGDDDVRRRDQRRQSYETPGVHSSGHHADQGTPPP